MRTSLQTGVYKDVLIRPHISSKQGRRKVFIGMSGGVDSSVSAALLKKQGFDVMGVFIKVWSFDSKDFAEDKQPPGCNQKEDRLDAMRVCAKLGIPFKTLDLEKEYKKEVVDYMVSEYKAGRTPNPDVMCNKHIKFGAFFDWAMKQGADYVATGHYARLRREILNSKSEILNKSKIPNSKLQTTNYELLTGLDSEKDQSYFLWTLTKKQLARTLFPVGGMLKPEVRKLAKKFGLATAEKKDSQGLCFLGKINMKEFLKNYIKPKIGDVLNESHEKIGTHDGAAFYTIGERHGFTITKKTPTDRPYFVVSKDIRKNTITVSHKNEQGIIPESPRVVNLHKCNWISDATLSGRYKARLRYRQTLCGVNLKIKGNDAILKFDEPQIVAEGQSAVIYDGSKCLGGGIVSFL